MIPVRTSPVPAVGERGDVAAETDERPSPGAPMSVSAPLSRTMQPKRSTARASASRRCASTQPDVSPMQPRQLALVRREDRSGRCASNGSSSQSASASTTDRQVELGEQPAHERSACRRCGRGRGRARLRACARPRRDLLDGASATALPVLASGRFTASSERSRAPAATRRARRRRRSPRRRGTRPRAARQAAPVSPREPPTTSTAPAVYLLSLSRFARDALEDRPRRRAGAAVSPPFEADVGDVDVAGVEAAGARRARPTLGRGTSRSRRRRRRRRRPRPSTRRRPTGRRRRRRARRAR